MIHIALIALSLGIVSSTDISGTLASDPTWELADIDGKIHKPFDDESTRGIALVFISTDCPIANSYQPLLQHLAEGYEKDGIRFFMIHPNPEVTADQVRKHASEFKIKSPVIIDSNQTISRRVGATVTPQAFVFARGQKTPIYQGRIDNLYAAYGKKRNVATTRDLAEALDAMVAGRPAKTSKTEAVGCFISYAK